MPRSWTPAAPGEPNHSGSFVLTSSTLTLSSTALISLTRLCCLGEVRLPCGLRHSLCTLHLLRFACLHQPVKTGVQSATPREAQHSIRVAGQALPGRDFHPARSTKLRLAHERRRSRAGASTVPCICLVLPGFCALKGLPHTSLGQRPRKSAPPESCPEGALHSPRAERWLWILCGAPTGQD